MVLPADCQSSMGWKGYARIGGASGPVLPYRTEDLAEKINLIASTGIHGGGVGSENGVFGSVINIAIGQAEYSGTIVGEVFGGSGNFALAFTELLKRAMGASSANHTLRICGFTPTDALILSPGGGATFSFPAISSGPSVRKALIKTFTLSGNPGEIVTYSANLLSAGFEVLNASTAQFPPATTEFPYEPVSNLDDSNPVPYYASNFTVAGSGETDLINRVTDWSLTIENNSYALYTFNNSNAPTDILQGQMVVNGSFKIYSPNGAFVFPLTQGATLSITLGTNIIQSGYVAFSTAPVTSSGGLNAPVFRDISFICIAKDANTASIHL